MNNNVETMANNVRCILSFSNDSRIVKALFGQQCWNNMYRIYLSNILLDQFG